MSSTISRLFVTEIRDPPRMERVTTTIVHGSPRRTHTSPIQSRASCGTGIPVICTPPVQARSVCSQTMRAVKSAAAVPSTTPRSVIQSVLSRSSALMARRAAVCAARTKSSPRRNRPAASPGSETPETRLDLPARRWAALPARRRPLDLPRCRTSSNSGRTRSGCWRTPVRSW